MDFENLNRLQLKNIITDIFIEFIELDRQSNFV